MARKKPAKSPFEPDPTAPDPITEAVVDAMLTKTAPQETVRHVPLDGSRRLYTVPVDSPIWTGIERTLPDDVKGAIVRLRPPVDASDDDIAALRRVFEKRGAERVIALPRPRSEVLPSGKSEAKAKAVGAREAVNALIEESNSKDKSTLRAICEKVMAKVGL